MNLSFPLRVRLAGTEPRILSFRIIFLVMVLLAATRIQAQQQQFPSDYWYEGKLITDTRDTLRGLVKYNMQNDMIQLQLNKQLQTFTARKVVFFEIFDQSARRYRQFYSLPYSGPGQYKAPIFFELLDEGKITLLFRESLEYKTYSSPYSYGSYTRLVLANKYYFLKEDGTITEFLGKKNDLLEVMGAKETEVQRFIKENKLNFSNKYDVARMVEYYNSLFK